MERRIHVLHEAGLFAGQLAVRMKRDAINDIIGEDLALQDYLAELGDGHVLRHYDAGDGLCLVLLAFV